MRVAPFGSNAAEGSLPESINTTTVCRRRPCKVHRNLSDESLPIRRYQPSVYATVLEALPTRLVVRSERHRIRDTNHTAVDPAPTQGIRDAEATISNSSLRRDHRQHGGDKSTFDHAQVQLAKHDLLFFEHEMQQKLRERRTNKRSASEKKVELRRTEVVNKTVHQPSNHCNWILSLALVCLFPHVFVISLTLETQVLFETRTGCKELPTMMFQQIVICFRITARATRCHKQFSTTTFLLSSKITQLDRRPAGTLCRPFPIIVTTKLEGCYRIHEKTLDSKTTTCRIFLMRNHQW